MSNNDIGTEYAFYLEGEINDLHHRVRRQNRIVIAVTVAALALAVLAAVLGFLAKDELAPAAPNCPTEDSCRVDYRDGAYHITEVRP